MTSVSGLIRYAERRGRFGWVVLRWTLAGLIAAHGWARFLADAVVPFGEWLQGLGIPLGMGVAICITALEIVGTPVFATGRLVPALAALYAAIYAVGIGLVHAAEGWFVVGLGRNGAEYSVLLIVCLLCVGLQHVRPGPASGESADGGPGHGRVAPADGQ